jgi:hypothetical protein
MEKGIGGHFVQKRLNILLPMDGVLIAKPSYWALRGTKQAFEKESIKEKTK